MTSRLKRKLNDLGVDTTSSKANENFCLIGTPLPPLEKSKDTGEFVPLWKQEVRDEKGRRRLHGAFTGGFSAGYFNTVGSKEGWTPATFVSSRNDRAKKKAARPEDFMDEEDLAEFRESQKLVDEHEEMDFGGTAAEKGKQAGVADDQDPIASVLADSFAPPPKDSVGAKILKKMGWKLGQGIGPRLTYTQWNARNAGFLDPSKEVEGNEEDLEEAKKHLYPRKDTPVLLFRRKDNFHGLGYTPGLNLNESVGGEQARGDLNISSGFGLGALNDADEDDLDVYDSGPSGRNRVAYDSSLGDDDHRISIGSRASRKQGAQQGPTVPPGITQTFHDGTPVLKGFVLSAKPVAEDQWFPMPKVPPGWKPDPRRVWEQAADKENKSTAKSQPQPTRTHAEWKASLLSADQRGSMLGEAPLPAKTRSVFEYLSQKDRDRLQSFRTPRDEGAPLASTADGAPPRPPSPLPPPPAPGGIRVPHLHPSLAKAALSGFQPFTADPLKHSRYTAFLTFSADAATSSSASPEKLGFGPLPHQSTDDFNKELDDYAKSATVFKPLSAAMAGRFRSSAVIEMGPKVVEGLHHPISYADNLAEETGEEPPSHKEKEEEEDPKTGAVRLGMYGPLTRETKPWQPAKLLCKRFGVKEPEVDMTGEAGAASAGFEFATGAAKREAWEAEAGGAAETSASASGVPIAMITESESADSTAHGEGQQNGPRNLANVGLGEDETQGRDILTYQRPAMDVFKAIFASDDEDSDEEDGDGDAAEATTTSTPLNDTAPVAAPAQPKAEPTPPPQRPARPNEPLEPVDPATFKPTFVPRSERDSRKDKDGKSKDKKKDREKKKAKAALMSFDAEDDGSIPSFGPAPPKEKDRERKKKRRKEKHREDEDDSMWVEKPAPEAVKNLSAPPGAAVGNGGDMLVDGKGDGKEAGPQRGRKRAIDFM
uniref:Extracellular lipase (EC) n=1 Tax=Ganoderma boninense TaxID=34458 RepID=A0A5K1K7P5_9APHY|nr:Extracellular lipase (EC [Ganoderma boninense]